MFIGTSPTRWRRGKSPIQAISLIHESKSYGRYSDRLLRLLVNKISLQGVERTLVGVVTPQRGVLHSSATLLKH
ncbi:MAG: hypothetical protein DRJ56_03810 [Thermoprotei archaeon]|nr:MAG: hypothetical protein DRJ56_03810 [Thermoprotei archaeon]